MNMEEYPEDEPPVNELEETNEDVDQQKARAPFRSTKFIDIAEHASRRQSNGTWAPIFVSSLCTATAKEEEYFERSLKRDLEKNLG